MNDKLREEIWQRDKGICQQCKKELFMVVDPYEEVIEDILSMKEIPIFKWSQKCWKCKDETDIVTYDFYAGFNCHIGDIGKLDKLLMQKYSFVEKVFSKTMELEVITNTCVKCGIIQGNFFIKDDLLNMKSSNINMDELIDVFLPNHLQFEDLPFDKDELKPYQEKMPLIAHVHHIDRNRMNNKQNNLILLCKKCHIKLHSELRN
jgi:hypothetical protein